MGNAGTCLWQDGLQKTICQEEGGRELRVPGVPVPWSEGTWGCSCTGRGTKGPCALPLQKCSFLLWGQGCCCSQCRAHSQSLQSLGGACTQVYLRRVGQCWEATSEEREEDSS